MTEGYMPPGRATTACIKADLKADPSVYRYLWPVHAYGPGEGAAYTELAKGIPTARSYCDSADAG